MEVKNKMVGLFGLLIGASIAGDIAGEQASRAVSDLKDMGSCRTFCTSMKDEDFDNYLQTHDIKEVFVIDTPKYPSLLSDESVTHRVSTVAVIMSSPLVVNIVMNKRDGRIKKWKKTLLDKGIQSYQLTDIPDWMKDN